MIAVTLKDELMNALRITTLTREIDVKIMKLQRQGKSFFYLTGDVDSVRAAVEAGIDVLEGTGLVLSYVVIPSPTDDISRSIL